ncbi:MAG: DUF971 domain-containing protein [Armatimonadetes bacterium]|nr:DUF971 domain-containing protein [Armatimonadota bacterium]
MTNQPASIKKKGNRELQIAWQDDHVSLYSFRFLRQNCPCATCVDEWTKKKILDEEKVPLDLWGLKVEFVGNYALHFTFSDRHGSGIYHFDHLRAICPCNSCRAAEGPS